MRREGSGVDIHGMAADRQHDGDAGGGERFAERADLPDAKGQVIVLENLLQAEGHGFQIALANRDYVEVAARLERGKAYRDQFRPHP